MSATSKPRTARTAAAKPAAAPAPSPAEDVTLNLDTLEREDTKQPFTFLHDGHVYAICDPNEMDWQKQLRAMGDPIYFLQHAMSAEDVNTFFATEMPAWKLDKIMTAYREHFGQPSLGE